MPGSPDRTSFTPGRVNVSPSDTQGGSRVPELGSLGSVRGALSNGRPYRDLGGRGRPRHLPRDGVRSQTGSPRLLAEGKGQAGISAGERPNKKGGQNRP